MSLTKVTLSSGKIIEVDTATGVEVGELVTSNGAATTRTDGSDRHDSRLAAYMDGASIQPVQNAPKNYDPVTRFWSYYIQGAQSLARLGFTGADVAFVLCIHGFVELHMPEGIVAAGTKRESMPSAKLIGAVKPFYKAVKQLPSRDEFFALLRTARQNKTA